MFMDLRELVLSVLYGVCWLLVRGGTSLLPRLWRPCVENVNVSVRAVEISVQRIIYYDIVLLIQIYAFHLLQIAHNTKNK